MYLYAVHNSSALTKTVCMDGVTLTNNYYRNN